MELSPLPAEARELVWLAHLGHVHVVTVMTALGGVVWVSRMGTAQSTAQVERSEDWSLGSAFPGQPYHGIVPIGVPFLWALPHAALASLAVSMAMAGVSDTKSQINMSSTVTRAAGTGVSGERVVGDSEPPRSVPGHNPRYTCRDVVAHNCKATDFSRLHSEPVTQIQQRQQEKCLNFRIAFSMVLHWAGLAPWPAHLQPPFSRANDNALWVRRILGPPCNDYQPGYDISYPNHPAFF